MNKQIMNKIYICRYGLRSRCCRFISAMPVLEFYKAAATDNRYSFRNNAKQLSW